MLYRSSSINLARFLPSCYRLQISLDMSVETKYIGVIKVIPEKNTFPALPDTHIDPSSPLPAGFSSVVPV